jgi:Lon protease-like protein
MLLVASAVMAATIINFPLTVQGFAIQNQQQRFISTTLYMSSTGKHIPRRNIRLPLLVDNINDDQLPRWNVPLPNSQLPSELTTASLYELKLDAAVHKMVIKDAISKFDASALDGCCYGHVIKREDEDLVGAIGCAGEILIGAPTPDESTDKLVNIEGEGVAGSLMVLARGSYRFRVREVVSSIPYPMAIVDELLDDETGDERSQTYDDYDVYDEMSSKELIQQILASLDKILNTQYEASKEPLSPLEQSILESASSPEPMAKAIQRSFDAEERLAVYKTFVASLLDIAPNERDRNCATAMMAGELANFPSDVRVQMLNTVDGVARLRIVLRELNSMLALYSAKRLTKSIELGIKSNVVEPDPEDLDGIGSIGSFSPPTAETIKAAEESQKDLKVGIPSLPPWANQIRNGVRVEYFWNEEEGWCGGIVVDDPVKIMDEIIITVQFDDDGSVHRLPLRGEDKARWRPG